MLLMEGGKKKQDPEKLNSEPAESLPYPEKNVQQSEAPVNQFKSKQIRFSWLSLILRILKFLPLSLVLILVIAYFYIMRASFLEEWVQRQFSESTNGSIELKITRASLFRGFSIENISVNAGADFDHKPILKIEKLNLFWNVFGFWAGDFGVHEVGVYRPHVYLEQRSNIWNIQALVKPSAKEEDDPEIKKPTEAKERTSAINLPFSIRVFAKIILEDFKLTVAGSDKSNSNPIEAGVENFTFRAHLLSKSIDTIPVNPLVFLEYIDTFIVQMNPRNSIELYFKNPQVETKTPFDLHLLLALDTNQIKPKFKSTLKIGNNSIPVKFSGKTLLPLGIDVSYDMRYNPIRDLFSINRFRLSVLDQVWLNLNGMVKKATSSDHMIADITLDQSRINLTELYPHLVRFTGNKFPEFSGAMSLAPMKIYGPLNDLRMSGKIKFDKVKLRLPQPSIHIPYFNLDYTLQFNFKDESTQPLITAKANADALVNGATLALNADFIPEKNINLNLKLSNFDPAVYADNKINGKVNAAVSIAGKNLNSLSTNISLSSPQFYYYTGKLKSGVNRFNLELSGNISRMLSDNPDINLKKIALYLKNVRKNDALKMIASTRYRKNTNSAKIEFRLNEFSANIRNLHATLNEEHQNQIEEVRQRIRGPVSLTGGTDINMQGENMYIHHLTTVLVPDYGIDDINIIADAGIKPGFVNIQKVSVTGLRKALDLQISGTLKEGMIEKLDPKNNDRMIKEKGWDPDINLHLNVIRDEMNPVFQEHSIKGTLHLNASFRNNIAKGVLGIENFYYASPQARLNNIKFNFPFEHNLLLRKTLNLTAANKERLIKNYNFSEPYNFTIDSIEIQHPIREKESIKIVYPRGNQPGFGASTRYKDNVFEIPAMQVYTLNGLVTGHDILFNVGRGRLNEMEFAMGLQIKDIDLKQLIPLDQAEAITDGSIRADLLFIGDRLDQPVENLNGYISVYKIGEQFGKQALKVVKPDTGGLLDYTIDNTIIVRKMDLELKEGLVYAKIIYRQGVLGNLIRLAGDKIVQERIPIPEFLQRAEDEAKVYKQVKEPENTNTQGTP